ncbi:hypothetical protein [Sphaerospermopsis sp. FACHB-1194]|nr:hypothetical protein [Sphaerospermopsis sp. FACHB-1194]MBD2147132.1 hypothetical protein [Sphaerospermopsis sp. FACHB-1194]
MFGDFCSFPIFKVMNHEGKKEAKEEEKSFVSRKGAKEEEWMWAIVDA